MHMAVPQYFMRTFWRIWHKKGMARTIYGAVLRPKSSQLADAPVLLITEIIGGLALDGWRAVCWGRATAWPVTAAACGDPNPLGWPFRRTCRRAGIIS